MTTRTIQKIIDGKHSLSRVLTWNIIEQYFADNGGNSMATKKSMNDLDSLVLTRNSTSKDYIRTFSDIIDRLDMTQLLLLSLY